MEKLTDDELESFEGRLNLDVRMTAAQKVMAIVDELHRIGWSRALEWQEEHRPGETLQNELPPGASFLPVGETPIPTGAKRSDLERFLEVEFDDLQEQEQR
eukprot:3715541-Amphidinium_carterae.1